jgi:ATP-dependent DNA ligase/DNA-binding HxlR family transcriptional regulator
MLAEQIPLTGIGPYLLDPTFVVQQKVDGDRVLVTVDDGAVMVLNKEGQRRTNPTPKALVREFGSIPQGRWAFDGELLDGELWLFDLPVAGDAVTPAHPYGFRLEILERVFSHWRPRPVVRLLPTARTTWAKERLVDQVLSGGGEGVILRGVDAPYLPGKRSRRMLKAKHTKTIDCIVTGVRVGGHDNCHVSVFDNGSLVEVGSCAMLGKPAVAIGDVVEVRYLYADTGRRLVQTAFLRKRDDKSPLDCTIDQLEFTDRTVRTSGGFHTMATTKRQAPDKGLGRTQKVILQLLANGPKTVRNIEDDGFGISAATARSTLSRLGMRGLVDRKYRYGEHEYFLTGEGVEVEKVVTGIEDE